MTSLSGIWPGKLASHRARDGERLLAHLFDGIARGYHFGLWESLKQSASSKPMVSMAMCDVDGRYVLTSGSHPIR
jgi:hypothetical protein